MRSIVIVPAGNVGIYDLFGKVRSNPYPPGLHIINPFASLSPFSLKTQRLSLTVVVPSKEGLPIQLEVSILYRLRGEDATKVYTTIGRNYVSKVLEPHALSAIRSVTSGYEAKALYTADTRRLIGDNLKGELSALVRDRGIEIEDTPLKQIILPPKLAESIELKLSAEQESQRMAFVLMRERQEAERKAIEAQGIADFQKIVSEGISPELLRWKGIEATEHISTSENAKVVIIGSGGDGLPVILNTSK